MQSWDLIMCRYFCIKFIDFMLKSKRLFEYTNLFSPRKYEKNGKKIFSIDFEKANMIKICRFVCDKYRKFKKPKI